MLKPSKPSIQTRIKLFLAPNAKRSNLTLSIKSITIAITNFQLPIAI
jgi:hypothetical protein